MKTYTVAKFMDSEEDGPEALIRNLHDGNFPRAPEE